MTAPVAPAVVTLKVTALPATGGVVKAGDARVKVEMAQLPEPGMVSGLLPVRSSQSRMRPDAEEPASQADDRRP